ncbi:hypothetical protein [Staphylococcus felis]|uniref:hypothetical protein n=1 Tax=Staphylococcus felis TaxID=46127 RepID=UPI00248106A0|nr:hypothetical protein [Staphylococcus felis]
MGKSYEPYDAFVKISASILKLIFSYTVYELVANILYFVAYSVNRFYAQDLVNEIVNRGIDPMIEDILMEQLK